MESIQFYSIKNISRRETASSGLFLPQGIFLQPLQFPVQGNFFRCKHADSDAVFEIPLTGLGLRFDDTNYRFFLSEQTSKLQSVYFAPENVSSNQLLKSIQGKAQLKPCWPCVKVIFNEDGCATDFLFTNQISPLF
jgi:hypothetical protein